MGFVIFGLPTDGDLILPVDPSLGVHDGPALPKLTDMGIGGMEGTTSKSPSVVVAEGIPPDTS